MWKRVRHVVTSTLLLLTLSTAVQAAPITFQLDTANFALTGPYAEVTIDLINPTTATVTFESLTSGGLEYLFGGNGAVALNVNADSFSVSGFTGTNDGSGFSNTLTDLSVGSPGNEDGFGFFNLTVDSFDGFSHSWSEIGFTLINTDVGGSWTDSLDVLIGNNLLQVAAAHVFACQVPCTQSNGAILTGFVSGFDSGPGGPPPPPPPPPPEPVPEPTTIVMLGSGLAAVLARRKMRKM